MSEGYEQEGEIVGALEKVPGSFKFRFQEGGIFLIIRFRFYQSCILLRLSHCVWLLGERPCEFRNQIETNI